VDIVGEHSDVSEEKSILLASGRKGGRGGEGGLLSGSGFSGDEGIYWGKGKRLIFEGKEWGTSPGIGEREGIIHWG